MKFYTKKSLILILSIILTNISVANSADKVTKKTIQPVERAIQPVEVENSLDKSEKIAIIDIETVLKKSQAMQDAQKKLSKKQDGYQKEIDKKQELLEAESKKISAKKSVLSEEAFNKEQEAFSKKVDDLKSMVESKQEILKKSSIDAINKINDNIKSIIEEIRQQREIAVVLSAASTVSYQKNIDISEEVLAKLNQKISKIDIK